MAKNSYLLFHMKYRPIIFTPLIASRVFTFVMIYSCLDMYQQTFSLIVQCTCIISFEREHYTGIWWWFTREYVVPFLYIMQFSCQQVIWRSLRYLIKGNCFSSKHDVSWNKDCISRYHGILQKIRLLSFRNHPFP